MVRIFRGRRNKIREIVLFRCKYKFVLTFTETLKRRQRKSRMDAFIEVFSMTNSRLEGMKSVSKPCIGFSVMIQSKISKLYCEMGF